MGVPGAGACPLVSGARTIRVLGLVLTYLLAELGPGAARCGVLWDLGLVLAHLWGWLAPRKAGGEAQVFRGWCLSIGEWGYILAWLSTGPGCFSAGAAH